MAFLTEPLGSTADVETLPQSSNNGASLSGLFPQKSSVPVSLGGVAPKRTEFNAIIKILGDALWQAQHGQQYEYNNDFTYSKGSLIVRDGSLLIASEETTGDFDASKWIEINNIDASKLVTVADAQTITGTKTFSEIIQGDISGSASSLNTPRTINLSGDATGSVTFDGSQDVTIPVSVSSSTSVENAKTATKLRTSRKIELTGDASGSVYFDGSQDVTINTTVDTANYSASAETASGADKLNTARAITLTGDVTGSASFDGSSNVSITSTAGDRIVTTDGAQTITGAKTYNTTLKFSTDNSIRREGSANTLTLVGGSDAFDNQGSVLFLHGTTSSYKGQFRLRAGLGSGSGHIDLIGRPDGVLAWGDKTVDSIVATEKGYNGYIVFRSGLTIQWGTLTTSSINHTLNFSKPFSNDAYQMVISSIDATTFFGLSNRQTTSITINGSVASGGCRWIAIGY